MSHQHPTNTLTERELDIARLITDGLSNHEIAQELVLTHGTVKWYCGQIYSKLGVNTRVQAVKSLQTRHLQEKSAIRTLSSSKVHLPTPLTPLVGRQREMVAIHDLLRANRLLTLTGAGGTGKTRLALAIAREAASEFADGVSFVDLAPVTDASLVIKAIGYVLGVMENPNEPLLETLKRALGERKHLLLIDNFEHVIECAPIISQLLASALHVKVLVTSREALHVSGEQEYAVPPLTLPMIEGATVEEIQRSEAIALFMQRVKMVQPDFQITDENAASIAEICTRLDGLPLAIELAAARCKMLSPEQMLARLRLDSRLNTLTGGLRDVPARQQTLRNTIAWSYNLLDDAEKMLFRRLAVFCEGRSLEAIEAICGDDLPIDILTGLASLVDKNLVQRAAIQASEPRFLMLEMLYEFAWEQLSESGEMEAMRRRHAAYFVALVERAEPELQRSHQQHWSQLLDLERDNLRLVLAWSVQHEVAVGLRMAGALWWNWFTHGYHAEGYQWTQRLLLVMDNVPSVYHPKFLIAAGRMALLRSDLAGAQRLLLQALEVARKVKDTCQEAWALVLISIIDVGEPEQAKTIAEEGLALFRELDDKAGLASAFNALGEIARVHGQDEHAKRNYEEAIAVAEQTGNIRRKYATLINLSYIAQHEHDHQRAITLVRQTLVNAREMKNQNDMAKNMRVLCGSLGAVGEPERAARLLGAAEAAQERIGAFVEPSDQAEFDRNIAEVRRLLDAMTFQAAWAEGRKMTLEQAIADVLGE